MKVELLVLMTVAKLAELTVLMSAEKWVQARDDWRAGKSAKT